METKSVTRDTLVLCVSIMSIYGKRLNIISYSKIFLFSCICIIYPHISGAVTIPPTSAVGGQSCGSVGYNLQTCDCVGATSVCVTDSSKCSAPQGVYPIAYVNIGRCYPGQDCPTGGVGRGGLQASEGGWNEPWINLKSSPGIARAERLIQQAKSKGYKSIDPDNTAEAVDTADMKMIVDLAQKYGMKVSIKNEEGQWAKLLAQYPQYKQNIVMVTAEECASYGDCAKYTPFKNLGIPVVHIQYANKGGNTAKLAQSIKATGGAGMLVPNEKHLRGVTTLGSACVNGDGITPGPGPTADQIAALSNGAQPYQQAGDSAPGAWAQAAPGQWAGSSPAQQANYNPGAGQWKQQDFDRLQAQAQPSFIDPNKPLPATGQKNPYATQDSWQEQSQKTAEPKKDVPFKKSSVLENPLMKIATIDGINALKLQGASNNPVRKASLRCTPLSGVAGMRPVISWTCGKGAVTATGTGFDTRDAVTGTTRVKIVSKQTLRISCLDAEGTELSAGQCTISVHRPVSADEAFKDTSHKGTQEVQSNFCFLSFCL